MKIDNQLNLLPLVKTNHAYLESFFGSKEITPMWVADLEFEIAKPIQNALINRISGSGFGYEYKPASFYEAREEWYKSRYDIDLDRTHVIHSPSIMTSISLLIEAFTNEKEGVVIQPPVFMEFKQVIRNRNRKPVSNALKLVDNRYEIDFDDLEIQAKKANNKILILCNPHNPIGRVWTKAELGKIVNICSENDLVLISDEIHKDIIFDGHQFTSLLTFSEQWEKIVICTSEAKSFNLCSLVDSMVIIPNDDFRKNIQPYFSKYRLGATNALSRIALEAAYTNGASWLNTLIVIVDQNVQIIEKELANSKINLIQPEGTYQVWLDFRAVFDDSKVMFDHITKHSKIGMNAGHWFGREGALFMRMNIGTSGEKVRKAIIRIRDSI